MTFYPRRQNTKTYSRFAFLLIAIGMLLSIDSFLGVPLVYKLWPLLCAILAFGFIGIFMRRGGREPVFLAIGIYLLCFTLLALFCSFTTWSYQKDFWPLYLSFLGISFLAMFFFSQKRYAFLLLGLLLLSLSGVFFVVFSLGGQYWWIVFILVGLSILIAERTR